MSLFRTLARERVLAFAFFAVLLAAGALAHRDYGISWDEPFQRAYGHAVYDYVGKGDTRFLEGPNKYYGPAYELLVVGLEKGLGLADSRSIYLMRHLIGFLLFFAGVGVFYLLCRRLLGNWGAALLGSLLLALHPRVFAHSFYNPKDLPVMVMFIVSMYTLVRFLDRRTPGRALVHAVCTGILIDIRILGGLVILFTLIMTAMDLAARRAGKRMISSAALNLVLYLVVLSGVVVLLWPTLWRNPMEGIAGAFTEMSRYPYQAPVLYMGGFSWARDLPWHYTLVWIGISTPLSYSVLFVLGAAHCAGSLAAGARLRLRDHRDNLVVLLWFFFPIIYLPLSGAVVFDEWRHTFFTYPAFVLIAVRGLMVLVRAARGRRSRLASVAFTAVIAGALAANTGLVAGFMIANHPHHHVYFNALAGGIKGAEGRFDLDYWGLSYREALEYIVGADARGQIRVAAYSRPGEANVDILPAADRARVVVMKDPYEAQYFMAHDRWHKTPHYPRDELFAVEVEGVKLMKVLRVIPKSEMPDRNEPEPVRVRRPGS
jgi:hypothetical protein